MIKTIAKIAMGPVMLFILTGAGPVRKILGKTIISLSRLAIGFAVLIAFLEAGICNAADSERIVLVIIGNKGQVGAAVFAGDERIGMMKRYSEARSRFSGYISKGEHEIKLKGNGQELWSQQITAYEGMEVYLDSSDGQTFTPPVKHEAPAVKVSTAAPPGAPTSPPAEQVSAAEDNPIAIWGNMLKFFQKKPASSTAGPASTAGMPSSPSVKQTPSLSQDGDSRGQAGSPKRKPASTLPRRLASLRSGQEGGGQTCFVNRQTV